MTTENRTLTYLVTFTASNGEEKELYKGLYSAVALHVQIAAEQMIRVLSGSGTLALSVGNRVQTNHWEKGVYSEILSR